MNLSENRKLDALERREARMVREKPPGPAAAVRARLEEKIPAGLRQTLDGAFYKAFQLLFERGGPLLEKTFPGEKLADVHAELAGALDGRALRRMNRGAGVSGGLGACAAALEGGALGVLGIGLPDIPVLLGLLLKNLYETALRYGFPYDTPQERCYLLLLLCAALGEKRGAYGAEADRFARALDHGWSVSFDLEGQIRETAGVLSRRLLVNKFVQGLPVVGVAGGVTSFTVSRRVSAYGALKYQKRFLEKKRREGFAP